MENITEENKIFIYKLTTDNGGAPCVHEKILSLAICKPNIRSSAQKNDWIVGFGGRSTIGERLIYIAKITENVAYGYYYKNDKYFMRPDCIYRWDEKNHLYNWKAGKLYHKNGKNIESDLGLISKSYNKANTLLSNHFVYFGKNGNESYKENYLTVKNLVEGLTQGHRKNHSSKLRKEIIDLINQYILLQSSIIPSEPMPDKICNNRDDCSIEC